jgi:DNA transposition AAA+ family ATPase
MDLEIKKTIAAEVLWLSDKTSQRYVASKAQVSSATISQMLAANWDQISEGMWRKIQSNLRLDLKWKVAETSNLKEMYHYCESAQKHALAICISDNAGKGKSNGFKFYDRTNKNVIHLECKTSWSKKSFVSQLLITMGVVPVGTAEEMLEQFNEQVKRMHSPLLILDQADKLKDPQLDLFMEFYNDHEGHLGIILSGVKALEKRIERGRQRSRVGYDELYSRIGSRFISLDPVRQADVSAICEANGVHDDDDKRAIYQSCVGDLRRVRREIQKIHIDRSATRKVSA